MRYPVLYEILEAENPYVLRDSVQNLINSGWEPQGGVSVSQTTRWVSKFGMPEAPQSIAVYCQAMVFYAEPESGLPTIESTGEDNA